MAGIPLGRATQALLAQQALGIPMTAPLVDNTPLGSFWVRVGITVNTTDTPIAITLPRIPSMYIMVRSNGNGRIYDGSNPAAWTGSLITLRAVTTVVVSLLIA